MKSLRNQIRALWNDESGQSTVEYILILAVVVMVATKFRSTFKDKLDTIMGNIGGQMDEATKQ